MIQYEYNAQRIPRNAHMERSAGRFERVSDTKLSSKTFFGFFVSWVEWAQKKMCARKKAHKIQISRKGTEEGVSQAPER